MNGDDVATLRQDIALLSNDVKHLSEKVGGQVEGSEGQEKRVRLLEETCIRQSEWRVAHDKEHKGISEQLGELGDDVKAIKQITSNMNGGNRKAAIGGAAVGGVTFTALFEAFRAFIELLK